MEALAFQQEYSFIASSVYDYSIYKGGSQKINLNGHSFTAQYDGSRLFLDGLPGGRITLEPGRDVILAFKGSTVAVLFSNSLRETAQKLQSLENNGWEVYRMFTSGANDSYAGFHIERITADFSKWTEKSIIRATYQETLTFRLEDGRDLSIITVYNNGRPYYFMQGEITKGEVNPYFDIGAKIKTRDGRITTLHQALTEISSNPNLIQNYVYKKWVFHPGANDHMKTQNFWNPNRTNAIFHTPSRNSSIPAQISGENPRGVQENTLIQTSPDQKSEVKPTEKEKAYQLYREGERVQGNNTNQLKNVGTTTQPSQSLLNQNISNNLTDSRLNQTQESEASPNQGSGVSGQGNDTNQLNNVGTTTQPLQSISTQSELLTQQTNMSNNLTDRNGSIFGVGNSLLNRNLTDSTLNQTQESETSSDVDQSNRNSSNSPASSTLNQSGTTVNGLSVERSAVEQTFTLNLGELSGVKVALTVQRYRDGSYIIQYGDSSQKIDGNREVIVYVQDGELKLQEANSDLKSELSRGGITFYTIKKATQQEPVQDWASKSLYTLTTQNDQQIKVVHYITQSGESRYFIEEQGKLREYNPTTDQERIMVRDSTGKSVELSKAVPERFMLAKRIKDDLYVEFDCNTKRNYDALSELELNDYEKSLLGSILPHLSPDEIRLAITELRTQEPSFYNLYKILYQKAIESKERSYRSPAIYR